MTRCDLELIARDPANFTLDVFNDGKHVRVNDIVDVWPSTKRYMVRNSGQKRALTYADYMELRKIILAAISGGTGRAKTKKLTLSAVPSAGNKRAIEPMTAERWRRDFE